MRAAACGTPLCLGQVLRGHRTILQCVGTHRQHVSAPVAVCAHVRRYTRKYTCVSSIHVIMMFVDTKARLHPRLRLRLHQTKRPQLSKAQRRTQRLSTRGKCTGTFRSAPGRPGKPPTAAAGLPRGPHARSGSRDDWDSNLRARGDPGSSRVLCKHDKREHPRVSAGVRGRLRAPPTRPLPWTSTSP